LREGNENLFGVISKPFGSKKKKGTGRPRWCCLGRWEKGHNLEPCKEPNDISLGGEKEKKKRRTCTKGFKKVKKGKDGALESGQSGRGGTDGPKTCVGGGTECPISPSKVAKGKDIYRIKRASFLVRRKKGLRRSTLRGDQEKKC